MPALPLDEAGKYVAGAYLVFLALVLIYVAIMAAKLARIDEELGELAELADGPSRPEPAADPGGADAGADQNAQGAHPGTDPVGADAGADQNA